MIIAAHPVKFHHLNTSRSLSKQLSECVDSCIATSQSTQPTIASMATLLDADVGVETIKPHNASCAHGAKSVSALMQCYQQSNLIQHWASLAYHT